MSKFCYACGSPLSVLDFKGIKENYCRFCTDKDGKLKSKEEIMLGIARWLRSWQPDLDDKKAEHRAELYLKAMPEWAD